jgi:subtilisin family serine protease
VKTMAALRWLLPALILLLLFPLQGAGATGVSSSIGVDVLRGVHWMDGDEVQVGVDGTGVPILIDEGFNRQLASMAGCYTPGRYVGGFPPDFGTGVLTYDPPRNDGLHSHGTAVASTLCASQSPWTADDLAGLAPGSPLYSADGFSSTASAPDLSAWFDEDPPRIFTSSNLGDSSIDWVKNIGGDPGDLLLVAAMGNSHSAIAEDHPNLHPQVMRIAGGFADGSAVWASSTHGHPGRPDTYPALVAPACVWVVNDPSAPLVQSGTVSSIQWTLIEAAGGNPRGLCPPVDVNAWATGYPHDPRGNSRGTSYSAPITAAAAALVLQVHPGLTPPQVREILEQSSDNFLPDKNGDPITTKQDFYDLHGWQAGWGFLNASNAVATAHYLRMHAGSSLEEALDCSAIEEVDGVLWLNPGPRCLRSGPEDTTPPEAEQPEPIDLEAGPEGAEDDPVRRTPFPGMVAALIVAGLGAVWRRSRL